MPIRRTDASDPDPDLDPGARVRALLLVALVVVLPGFFLTRADLRPPWLVDELFPVGHVGFFAVLAWVLAGALERSRLLASRSAAIRAAVAVAVATALGAAVELVQSRVGRGATLEDVAADLAGALLGVLPVLPARARRRLAPIAVIAVVAVLAVPAATLADRLHARAMFPVLAAFDSPLEVLRTTGGVRVPSPGARGGHSLRVPVPATGYGGLTLARFPGDWRGRSWLIARVHLSPGPAVPLTLSVGDARHVARGSAYGDRYDGRFELRPGWNEVRVPLAAIVSAPDGRRADPRRLRRLVLFVHDAGTERMLHFDEVRLE